MPDDPTPTSSTIHDDVRPVVDVAVLRDLVGDDDAAVDDFLAEFRRCVRVQGDEILAACAVRDLALAAAVAHKLKASARSVGALALGQACADIERSSRGGDGDGDEVDRCRDRLARSRDDVDAFLARRLADD